MNVMNAIVYRAISLLSAILCAFSNLSGSPAAKRIEARQFPIPGEESCEAGNGRVSVHDPSVVQDRDGVFYVFGSHGCAAKSTDFRSFSNVASGVNDNNCLLVPNGSSLREALSKPLSWTDTYQQQHQYEDDRWETGVWAPCVIYNQTMGKYCYYACSSVWGTPHSVIWFGSADSIEGPYENIKCIVYSGFDNFAIKRLVPQYSTHYSFTNIGDLLKKGTLSYKEVKNAPWFTETGHYNLFDFPNAIDPAVFYDKNGELWMVYGSYSGGIFIMPLDEKTGEPDYRCMRKTDGYDLYYGKRIVRLNEMNEGTGEGSFITYDPISGYYYLYVTYCGLNALGGYNIREYRSKNVDGPYIDAAGHDARDDVNSGVKLFGNYQFSCLDTAYLAGGHSSSLVTKDGKMFQVYHTRFNLGNEWHQVRVHQMARTENGWATVLPFEYTGETVDSEGFDAEALAGEYEFVAHGTISNGCADWADVDHIIAPTQQITLNADGSITGLRIYEAIKQNTAVSSREAAGSWFVKSGTAYITFVIDGTVYEGVLCRQTEENTGTEKIVFSAVGENNECIWGVKM